MHHRGRSDGRSVTCQLCRWCRHDSRRTCYKADGGPDRTRGRFDMYIGEPDLWAAGLRHRSVCRVAIEAAVRRAMRAQRVLIDPRVINERAIARVREGRVPHGEGAARQRVPRGRVVGLLARWSSTRSTMRWSLTAALAPIDSVNPGLVPGAAGEGAVADVRRRVVRRPRLRGAPHRGRARPARTWWPCAGGAAAVVRCCSTVTWTPSASTGAETMRVRLARRTPGTAAGVLDTKGGLAAAMMAAASVRPGELAGDLIVAAVADEEFASVGTEALVARLDPRRSHRAGAHRPGHRPQPSRLRAWCRADVRGSAVAHVAPDRGANTVHAAARAITALAALDDRGRRVATIGERRPIVLANARRQRRSDVARCPIAATCWSSCAPSHPTRTTRWRQAIAAVRDRRGRHHGGRRASPCTGGDGRWRRPSAPAARGRASSVGAPVVTRPVLDRCGAARAGRARRPSCWGRRGRGCTSTTSGSPRTASTGCTEMLRAHRPRVVRLTD